MIDPDRRCEYATNLLADALGFRVGGQAIQPRIYTADLYGQDAQ